MPDNFTNTDIFRSSGELDPASVPSDSVDITQPGQLVHYLDQMIPGNVKGFCYFIDITESFRSYGERVTGPDGVFKKAGLAAVAVMEKRSNWDEGYSADERSGNWGFAFYDAKGMPKENELDCAGCHKPLSNQDYIFSFSKLAEQ